MASGFNDTMKGDMVTRKLNIVYPLLSSPVITLSGMTMTESDQISCIGTLSKHEGDEDRMSEKRPNGVLVITDDQGYGALCATAAWARPRVSGETSTSTSPIANSVCVAYKGQVIGMGAASSPGFITPGWPATRPTSGSFGSILFRDNIDRTARSNGRYVAQTGGSTADEDVTEAADEYGMVLTHTGLRQFLHQGLIR